MTYHVVNDKFVKINIMIYIKNVTEALNNFYT